MLKVCYKSAVSQQLEESSIDGLRGVFRVPGESVGVLAEGVHVLAVAYQLFDFPSGGRFDPPKKKCVPNSMKFFSNAGLALKGPPPPYYRIPLLFQQPFPCPFPSPPLFQHGTGKARQHERPDCILILALCFLTVDVDRSAHIHRVALHICPAQPQQLPAASL